ncbi:MAG: hypothetical protein SGJ02_05780 [bacterium]|nr:hypothetical protein [bacterium]
MEITKYIILKTEEEALAVSEAMFDLVALNKSPDDVTKYLFGVEVNEKTGEASLVIPDKVLNKEQSDLLPNKNYQTKEEMEALAWFPETINLK